MLQLTSDAIAERVSAMQQLLMVPFARMPDIILRRPIMLQRTPRALAKDIQQLAAALGISAWTAASMVAGYPAILGSNVNALARRWVCLVLL